MLTRNEALAIRTVQSHRYPNWMGLDDSAFRLLSDNTFGLIGGPPSEIGRGLLTSPCG